MSAPAVRILVSGCLGQIGSELLFFLRNIYGADNVIGTDVRAAPTTRFAPFLYLDVTKQEDWDRICVEQRITWIVHNAALVSVVGEQNPALCVDVNALGTRNALEAARKHHCRILVPSSIAAFGPDTPMEATPDETIQHPTTMYGITKVWTELLGEYYHRKWGVDFRCLRYPGIISWVTEPGGGTTDYAVAIYYDALKTGRFSCFLGPNSKLPMMYMDDCLECTHRLLSVPRERLTKCVYNVGAIDFTPAELVAAIKKKIPNFQVSYDVIPMKQAIADSWPKSLNDSAARRDWGWNPKFNIDTMTDDMLLNLRKKFGMH